MKGNQPADKQRFANAIRHGALLILLVLAKVMNVAFIIGKTAMEAQAVADIWLKGHLVKFEREIGAEHGARAARPGRLLLSEYGDFIRQLAHWMWFWTITFRDSFWDSCSDSDSLRPPSKDWALRAIDSLLHELQQEVGSPIIWVIGADFGKLGRFHLHILLANVDGVFMDEWKAKASRRFGRNKLDYYDPSRSAAYYVAQHALTDTGDIHFGGAGLPEERLQRSLPVGRVVIARSANVPSSLFHMTLGKRRKR